MGLPVRASLIFIFFVTSFALASLLLLDEQNLSSGPHPSHAHTSENSGSDLANFIENKDYSDSSFFSVQGLSEKPPPQICRNPDVLNSFLQSLFRFVFLNEMCKRQSNHIHMSRRNWRLRAALQTEDKTYIIIFTPA